MTGMICLYIAIAILFGSIYYLNLKRDPLYSLRKDSLFLTIIALACAPFAAPIALAFYIVWRSRDKE